MTVIQRNLYLCLLFIGYVLSGPTTEINVTNSQSSLPNIVWNLHMKYVPKPNVPKSRLIQRVIEYGVITNVLHSNLNSTTIEPPIGLLTKMGILKTEENSASIQKVFITCSFKILFSVIFIILL